MKEAWLRGLIGREGDDAKEIKEIAVDSIVFNPYQARKNFDDELLNELADSIKQHGVLQPILVRPLGRGYELVAGERRVRACKRIGRKTIPAVVKQLTDDEMAVLCLVENLQREDLGFLEEAEGYQQLLTRFGLTQEELARHLGKSQSTIANKLRLLKLPSEVRELLSKAGLTERHARALLQVDDSGLQVKVIEEIVNKRLNVKETEKLISELIEGKRKGRRQKELGRRKVIPVVKDMRIAVNSFKQAVKLLNKSGIEATLSERDTGEYLEIYVRVRKPGLRATGY